MPLHPAVDEQQAEHRHDGDGNRDRPPRHHAHEDHDERRGDQSQRDEDAGVAAVGDRAHDEFADTVGDRHGRERPAQVGLVVAHGFERRHGDREVLAYEVVAGIADEDTPEYLTAQAGVLFVDLFGGQFGFVCCRL